jgi:glycopeptide antibiotics resistance protein
VVAAVVAYRARTADNRTILLRLIFVAYVAAVVSVTLFPFQIVIGKYAGGITFSSLQLLPLLLIDPTNFALNVILFVPFGLLFPLLSVRGTLRRTFVAGMLTSLTIEILQLLHALFLDGGRATDINDLIANTLGTVLGYALLRLLLRTPPARVLLGDEVQT